VKKTNLESLPYVRMDVVQHLHGVSDTIPTRIAVNGSLNLFRPAFSGILHCKSKKIDQIPVMVNGRRAGEWLWTTL
jgi:hypothetical protein